MALEPFFASVVIIFLSEIVDKTQLVILGLTLKFKQPFPVFLGALTAHSLMDLFAILMGFSLPAVFPVFFMKRAVGSIFLVYGIYLFIKIFRKIKTYEKKRKISARSPFVISFFTILASEFGDKTQVASGLLAAQYSDVWFVFFGAIVALALAIGLNVFVSGKLAKRLPRMTIKVVTSLLFIVFGIIILFFQV